MISQAAVDLIVAAEVTSRATYEKKYQHPEWPGGQSGITIAIGYDVGYATEAKLRSDWTGRLSPEMIGALIPCCGVTGAAANAILARVRPLVTVPWAPAMEVFNKIDEPSWEARVCAAISGANKLPPDCLGALTSLAYNRGASFNQPGDRYTEMRNIRAAIMAGRLKDVPAQFRSMKRLWTNGLVERREAEARLWEKGLTLTGAQPPRKQNDTPPPMLPPASTSASEHGSGGAVVVATGAAVGKGIEAGMGPAAIAAIVFGGLLIAGLVWLVIRAYRTREITAREKDLPPGTTIGM